MAAMVASSSIARIKKNKFSAPSTCPIDLFGPLANGRILKQLHAAFRVWLASVITAASSASFYKKLPVFALFELLLLVFRVIGLSFEVLQQAAHHSNGIQTALRRRMPGTNPTGLGGHVGLATGTRYARGIHGARRLGRVAGV